MKIAARTLIVALLAPFFSVLTFNAVAQTYEWHKVMGSAGAEAGNYTAVDNNGDIYITGSFTGTADFDPGAGVSNLISNGFADIYLAKYDTDGNLIWAVSIGGTGTDEGQRIAINNSNEVYLVGSFNDVVDFDPGAAVVNLTSNGSSDAFLAKFLPNGTFVWAVNQGGADIEIGKAVAVDSNNDVVIVGSFETTVDFDPGAGTDIIVSNGAKDIFMSKFDNNGAYLWTITIGSNDGFFTDDVYAVAIDSNDDIYITGTFYGTVDFDGGAGVFNITATSPSCYLAKYSAASTFIWAFHITSSGSDFGYDLAIDNTNFVYMVGMIDDPADFDPGAGSQIKNTLGSGDGFVAKYSSAGAYQWAFLIGGTSSSFDQCRRVTLDDNDNIYVTGEFYRTVDFDPGVTIFNISAPPASPPGILFDVTNVYLAKYCNTDGSFLGAMSIFSANSSMFTGGVVTDGCKPILFSGFTNTIDVDPSTTNTITETANNRDVLLAKYLFLNHTADAGNDVSICSGDSTQLGNLPLSGCTQPYTYTWTNASSLSGQIANPFASPTTTTIYELEVSDGAGCISTETVTVTVNPAPTVSFTATPSCPCNIINFTSSGTGTSWNWTFGDGSTSTAQNPSHTYTVPGNYYVRLFVTDANNCTNSYTEVITVCGAEIIPSSSKSDNHWMFPKNSGLAFSSGSPLFFPGNPVSVGGEGASAISHPVTGNLLFYTHGNNVWDASHNVMSQGTNLQTGGNTMQGSLIIPFPGDTNKYYIFTISGFSGPGSIANELRYSVVDMRLNGGLGDVVTGQSNIFLATTNGNEGLTGVEKIAATCSRAAQYWVVIAPDLTDCGTYHSFLIDSSQVYTTPVVSNLSAFIPGDIYCSTTHPQTRSAVLFFSKNGQKMAHNIVGLSSYGGGIIVIDFDKNTGIFSNPLGLKMTRPDEISMSLQFSPDNKLLYTTSGATAVMPNIGNITQFNLLHNNPQSTATVIYSSSISATPPTFQPQQMWTGLDDKIYFSRLFSSSIGAINNPNVIGVGANVDPAAVPLSGNEASFALQNIVPLHLPLKDTLVANYTYTISNCNQVQFTNLVNQLTHPACSFYANDTLTFLWDFGDGSPLTPAYHATHNYAAGTYNAKLIVLRARTCNSDTLTQTFIIPPLATFTQSLTICQGDSIMVGTTVHISSGTYVDTLQNAATNGCDSIVTTNLTVINSLATSLSYTECEGFAVTVGTSTYTVTGLYNDTLISSVTGCDSIITTNLTITTPTVINQTFVECEGFTVTVGVNTYSTTGVFTDVMNSCDTTITDLTINPAPQFMLIKADDNCGEGIGSATAEILSGSAPITYNWSTGGNDSLIENLPAGTYTLIVTDNNGCSNSDSLQVNDLYIDCDFYLYLPNVFSPNGDGVNDLLLVKSKGVKVFALKIYNRWGNLVFQTINFTEGWDGKHRGADENTGVFTYVLEATFENGNTIQKNGNISLLR